LSTCSASWPGTDLLAAHVTGNLIFLSYDITHAQYQLVIKLATLPIFAVSVAVAAWFIGTISARGRYPFLPSVIVQAAALCACMIARILPPSPRGPDDTTVAITSSIALVAMALRNTTMRVILNNLPAITVMTGKQDACGRRGGARGAGFGAAITPGSVVALSGRAKQVGYTLSAFAVGAIGGGLAQAHVGYPGLLLPIAVLVGLIPFGHTVLRAAAQF
jgi:uncharacterized membrane protein YoaK (UPF0700 family)